MMLERDLKREVMDYLDRLPGCYAKVIQVKGIKGRKSPSKGVLDIMASYYGRAVAIETKLPGRRLEESQSEFIDKWTRLGRGIAIVAYSLEDVIDGLKAIKLEHDKKLKEVT